MRWVCGAVQVIADGRDVSLTGLATPYTRSNFHRKGKKKKKCCPYFSMACSLSSSSFCRAITAMMIFLSSSVRWLRSGISGMDGGAVGGRGPPWGPTEADIFSTNTTPPPSPPPPPPPRRVVSADRFSRSGFRATPHDMVHGRSGSGGRSSGEKREPLMFRRHPRLCFLCVCLSSPGRSPPPPACPPLPSTARIHGEPIFGVFFFLILLFFLHGGSRVELRGPLDHSLVCGASAVVRLELDVRAV